MQRQIGLSNSSNNHSFDNDKYPSAHLMANQTEINSKMRKILIDWIIDVHLKYSLLPETLFIAINLIDRYTERNIITRKKYQLVGVTCLMIAAKYEEIYPPQIDKFSYITDNAYKREDIIECEIDILQRLDFGLTFPTPLRFLERYSRLAECDTRSFYIAKYMIELSLLNTNLYRYSPSVLACAAIFVSFKIMNNQAMWTNFMIQ